MITAVRLGTKDAMAAFCRCARRGPVGGAAALVGAAVGMCILLAVLAYAVCSAAVVTASVARTSASEVGGDAR
jgi:hypothetical protein